MRTKRTRAFATALALAIAAAPAGATTLVIDFDDLAPAPLLFADTLPLTDRYAAQGVVFGGVDGGGGAILDADGSPGTTGFSPPNFLAFNDEAVLANEAVPGFPETITFDPPVRQVAFRIGDFFPAVVTVDAYDGAAALLDSQTIVIGKVMQKVVLEGAGIASVVVTSGGPSAAIDEVAFSDWGSCSHDECDAGAALVDGCSACASAVCDETPSCCDGAWTTACAKAVAEACGAPCPVVCGDANDDFNVTASDALAALRTSVGTDDCVVWRCDFNGDERIAVTDAQSILRTAVDQPTTPNCPPAP